MTIHPPANVQIKQLQLTLTQQELLHDVNLDILPGELFVVLGGAEAGKTALLRTLAGLDPITSGSIWIDDEKITDKAPHRRHIGLMLQDFPLWPQMTVGDNIVFGLRQQGLSRGEAQRRAVHYLGLVGLRHFLRHLPDQLNASQRQRTVLARTLAGNARLVLLDEPFSAQGPQLRAQLLRIVRREQQQSGITTLLTTQEPLEALRWADRIAFMHQGTVQQVGTPAELYDRPGNRGVAAYLGDVNLIDGEVEYAGDQPLFRAANGIVIPLFDHPIKRARIGTAMFRPRELRLVREGEPPFGDQIRFQGRVEHSEFLGDTVRYEIDVGGHGLLLDQPRGEAPTALQIGDQVTVALDPNKIRILEP